ncbi:HEAT repeat domain-containing protein [Catellatospora tritici]|uniref:HEAT repeat domain-containing protein n=1 Tax=Catellatospora tritici TaxID=2851566 RepID=UPI001C2DDE5A|nr:HEAT repeat domain-containing protein [Catellatospora tritici]MBV1850541.1 HEAT repeat domain-containing protein [Catellatospora tritici]
MVQEDSGGTGSRLRAALAAPAASVRLQAALTAGTRPHAEHVEPLVERCAVEPDFFVRDMLTWALTRHEAAPTVDRLLIELKSATPQARSQALHTLSKIGARRVWSAITSELLRDSDDEVARVAWRTAAGLVPPGSEARLAEELSTQFNRGDRDVRLSLSRAFATLGEAALPVVERAKAARDPGVRAHAMATERIMRDPEEGFDAAIAQAQRTLALLGAPVVVEG